MGIAGRYHALGQSRGGMLPMEDALRESGDRHGRSGARVTVALEEVPLPAVAIEGLRDAAGSMAWERLIEAHAHARELLEGRAVWSINSTTIGGGVAEILRTMLPYARAGGLDARWLIVRAGADFFRVTKRIHNFLHEHLGDGGSLGPAQRSAYERVLDGAGRALRDVISPRDLVVLHDPQTLGLAVGLKRLGATVIWRCHIGTDRPGGLSEAAWDFLWPYVQEQPDVAVFSRRASVPTRLPPEAVRIIVPSIDPCSVKNADMSNELAASILVYTGLVERPGELSQAPAFHRVDGTPRRLCHRCDVLRTGPAPRLGRDRLVVHVCRWDRIKDPIGVMRGFAEHTLPHAEAHLILAGPTVHTVTDDPEESGVLDEVQAAWRALAHQQRRRVTVACVPMHDVEENAAIVNALQRHADVIVKKSFEEGFGLGVTEALWKRRAVVASDVGGHRDQIKHGQNGLLVDPTDPRSFGHAIAELLGNPARASALGDAGHSVVERHFLHTRQLAEWDELLAALVETTNTREPDRGAKLQIVRDPEPGTREEAEVKMSPRDDMHEQASLDPGALDPGGHDDLTGLWNRRRFEDELDRTPRDGERRALLCIDVDGYRDVIQRHGPHTAEGVIRSISYALAQRLRPHETLARIGGDEFAAVLPGMAPHLLRSLADDLCTAVREQSHPVGSSRVHATVSIGGAFLDPGTPTHNAALTAAHTALHNAKVAGGDRAIVHQPPQATSATG